jgi:hypothetical protein
MMVNIVVSKDFSKTPFGRYVTDSPFSAEKFRRDLLVPAFNSTDQDVIVDFSGIALGIGSSFLEEAFGGLIRKEGLPKSKVQKRLVIISEMPFYKEQIDKFIAKAEPERI